MIEDMKFSYNEKDAYKETERDLRQMHVKYMYMVKESFQLFSFHLFSLRKDIHQFRSSWVTEF